MGSVCWKKKVLGCSTKQLEWQRAWTRCSQGMLPCSSQQQHTWYFVTLLHKWTFPMFRLSYYIIYTLQRTCRTILTPDNNTRKPEDFILLNSRKRYLIPGELFWFYLPSFWILNQIKESLLKSLPLLQLTRTNIISPQKQLIFFLYREVEPFPLHKTLTFKNTVIYHSS